MRTIRKHASVDDPDFRAYHKQRADTDLFSRDVIRTLSRLDQADLTRRSAGKGGKTDAEDADA